MLERHVLTCSCGAPVVVPRAAHFGPGTLSVECSRGHTNTLIVEHRPKLTPAAS